MTEYHINPISMLILMMIHITKQPMLQAFKKVTTKMEYEYIKHNIDNILMDNFAILVNETNDIFINTKKCFDKNKIKSHGHIDTYTFISATISHESMHILFLKEQNKLISDKWDNIADKLEKEGYLGG